MESRPPQESPRQPTAARKPNGSGGSPTPPWLWLLLIAGFGLIFWHFQPKNEAPVPYYPWFLDPVEAGNIRSLLIHGLDVRGELKEKVVYTPASSTIPVPVTKFSTYFPAEASI